ncbi:MAG: hypothetical protein Q8P04_02270 [bacterium]|nr:hypothetical protein [bacterium]
MFCPLFQHNSSHPIQESACSGRENLEGYWEEEVVVVVVVEVEVSNSRRLLLLRLHSRTMLVLLEQG